MRNWNLLDDSHRYLVLCGLPAYLWGIETGKSAIIGAKWMVDCQPTYEELKLAYLVSIKSAEAVLPAYLWGIETRSGNCFYLRIQKLPAYLWGIETSNRTEYGLVGVADCQPTYEELKPLSECFCYSAAELLPAYLWGIETQVIGRSLENCRRLPAYLWGIETCDCGNEVGVSSDIASLPMRNWNFFLFHFPLSISTYCQPTYEELKLSFFYRF